ncbi:hypothetical protein AAVH_39727, partial [Aphelenchoides avenae]
VWRGKSFGFMVFACYCLPFLLSLSKLKGDVRLILSADAYVLINADTSTRVPFGVISTVVTLGTCTTSIVLELWTFAAYRRMSVVYQRRFRDDFNLLCTFRQYLDVTYMFVVYAILGLCAQCLVASFYVITLISTNLVSAFVASAMQTGP